MYYFQAFHIVDFIFFSFFFSFEVQRFRIFGKNPILSRLLLFAVFHRFCNIILNSWNGISVPFFRFVLTRLNYTFMIPNMQDSSENLCAYQHRIYLEANGATTTGALSLGGAASQHKRKNITVQLLPSKEVTTNFRSSISEADTIWPTNSEFGLETTRNTEIGTASYLSPEVVLHSISYLILEWMCIIHEPLAHHSSGTRLYFSFECKEGKETWKGRGGQRSDNTFMAMMMLESL